MYRYTVYPYCTCFFCLKFRYYVCVLHVACSAGICYRWGFEKSSSVPQQRKNSSELCLSFAAQAGLIGVLNANKKELKQRGWRRWRKRLLKSIFALFQSLSLVFKLLFCSSRRRTCRSCLSSRVSHSYNRSPVLTEKYKPFKKPFTPRVNGVVWDGSNFRVCGWNPVVLPFKWNLFSSTFTCYYLFSMWF